MSWAVLTDPKILKKLRTAKLVGCRFVCLSPPTNGAKLDVEDLLDPMRLATFGKFERSYELRAYDTKPATVLVHDNSNDKAVGAYVWTGSGGKIASSGDIRMVELANALDEEFQGVESSGPKKWNSPEATCSCCGETYNTGDGRAAVAADVQLEPGVRASAEMINTPEKWLMLLGQYTTDQQLKKVSELMNYGCRPAGMVNLRHPDDETAADHVVVQLFGLSNEQFSVTPDGTVEADF